MTIFRSSVFLAVTFAACAPGRDAAPDTATAAAPAARAGLVLDGAGLRALDTATGSMRPIDFGTAADAALATFTAILGAPAGRGTNTECSATPMTAVTWANGLTVRLVEDRFVGWGLASSRPGTRPATAGSKPLTTGSGIGIGSTRAALDGAYSAKVAGTTLGTEFTAGGLAGLLSGDGPDARVTDLWAGLGCTMR